MITQKLARWFAEKEKGRKSSVKAETFKEIFDSFSFEIETAAKAGQTSLKLYLGIYDPWIQSMIKGVLQSHGYTVVRPKTPYEFNHRIVEVKW